MKLPRLGAIANGGLIHDVVHQRVHLGATFGLLTVNTALYVGPLADIAGGVDLSTIGSAALAGLIYVAFAAFYRGMTRSADELVTEFCKKWSTPDPEELAGYFTEDGVYHNIPMDAVQGREAIKQFIAGFTARLRRHRLPGAQAGQRRQPGDERAHRRHAAQETASRSDCP